MTAAIDAMKAAQTYAIDKTHSEAAFQVRHLLTKVRGRFTEFAGTAVLDQEHPEQSSASLTIDASSVDTARRIVTRTCGPTKRVDSWSGTRCKSLFRLRQSCSRVKKLCDHPTGGAIVARARSCSREPTGG